MNVSDNPIENSDDDTLGRSDGAYILADHLLALDLSGGFVVGILGPWGSGKTSYVNLMSERFVERSVPVVSFNPWMFSGAEQLVSSFFFELSAQLKIRPGFSEIADDLADYGEGFSGLGWLPLIGPWVERGRGATKLFAKLLQRRKEGVGGRRARLHEELSKLTDPLFVIIDDIDRLTTSEIRDVFKLVRLTASFPNVVYVLAFDRARVESALAEDGIPGRDYLEKIVQLGFDLPAVPDAVMQSQILGAISEVVGDEDDARPFDVEGWPDVFVEVIRPLIRNMRDVRRFTLAIVGGVSELKGRVNLVDIIALEAVRVFLPDTLALIDSSSDALTATGGFGREAVPDHEVAVQRLLEESPDNAPQIRALITRLFPAAQRHVGGSNYGDDWKAAWLRERRVAHPDVLRLYLERVEGSSLLALNRADTAWRLMPDQQKFEEFMSSVEPQFLEDTIASLQAYESEFDRPRVVPGVVVLLNLLPRIPERELGMFDFGKRITVTRVTLRLLRSLDGPVEVEEATESILPQLHSLSAKFELVRDVGNREGEGHGLVEPDSAARFERRLRDEIRQASADELSTEENLLRLLALTIRKAEEGESELVVPDDPGVTLQILRTAWSETRSQQMGSRAVQRSSRLAWPVIEELLGDEATVRDRIEALRSSELAADETELLDLADRYLGGWRPNDFGDSDDEA